MVDSENFGSALKWCFGRLSQDIVTIVDFGMMVSDLSTLGFASGWSAVGSSAAVVAQPHHCYDYCYDLRSDEETSVRLTQTRHTHPNAGEDTKQHNRLQRALEKKNEKQTGGCKRDGINAQRYKIRSRKAKLKMT